jgi:heparan-alpha-glucosaminide N-acetyltransferase
MSTARTEETRFFPTAPKRLISLDIFRGMFLLLLLSGGLGVANIAKHFPQEPAWQKIAQQFRHVTWEGCVLWDLIQPAFLFAAGVSLAFWCERYSRTYTYSVLLWKAIKRSIVFILLGIFLRSNGKDFTQYSFVDCLTQLGLGYLFVFFMWRHNFTSQAILGLAILVCYWCFFYFYPVSPEFNYAEYKLPADYHVLEGARSHWNIHANAAAKFDNWFLNLFPPEGNYRFTPGGYQTLNFIPALVTMLCGLMAGQWLHADYSMQRRLGGLLIAGALGIAAGYVLHIYGICPVVKPIWTPSWAIYSAGWCSLILGVCFFFFDMVNLQPIATLVIAVGRNTLTLYILHKLISPWLLSSVRTHCNETLFRWLAEHNWVPDAVRANWMAQPPADIFALCGIFASTAEQGFVLLILSAIAYWMYRRQLFIKI